MEFALIWIVGAVIVAAAASGRGHSGLGWFLLSLLISPLLALIAVLVIPNRAAAEAERRKEEAELADTKPCPRCAERVKKAAAVCRFCGHEFEPEPEQAPLVADPSGPFAGKELIEVYNGRTIFRHANGRPAVLYKDGSEQDFYEVSAARRLVDEDKDGLVA